MAEYNFALAPRRSFRAWLLSKEALRAGIVALANYCQRQGWEVWVYPTSYRSAGYIRRLF